MKVCNKDFSTPGSIVDLPACHVIPRGLIGVAAFIAVIFVITMCQQHARVAGTTAELTFDTTWMLHAAKWAAVSAAGLAGVALIRDIFGSMRYGWHKKSIISGLSYFAIHAGTTVVVAPIAGVVVGCMASSQK